MNTNNIKKYAPIARRDFIEAVGKRLNQFGVYNKGNALTISELIVSGSVMQIDGNAFDAGLALARERLVFRAEQLGFAALVEQVAYTWFNRLCAIRFMELKPDYLEHGFRVLSHPEKINSFEILDHAQDVAEALGLERNHIVELKLAGNKDEALYRELLLGQCHQLHQAMPFLFEALDDETELLLPDNLTRTDSILRGLVDGIPEEDWEQVEIIGWLYQFYISEKKDQVIGKVVKSEDIPAATQLFTPNWIVKYLVQNSIGRQWLMTYPDSGLKAQMDYYITPAEQEPAVGVALAAITPTSIEPETIKVIDPACGSGHILVEAYNLLKAIYEERGYRSRDIPKLILENNLYGLDIDDRAAQLAGFALMMKAREDDRRIFTRDIKLNVLALQATQGLDLPELWRKLALNKDAQRGITESLFDDAQINLVDAVDDVDFTVLQSILVLFEHAKIFGSLIQVSDDQTEFLQDLKNQLQTLIEQGDSFQKPAAIKLMPFVQQASLLAQRYDAVIANPPYMGGKGMNPELKVFAQKHFPNSKSDMFSMFMERCLDCGNPAASLAFVTPYVWMFISSYEGIRSKLLTKATLQSLIQLEYNAFEPACVPVCTFIVGKAHIPNYTGSYIKLSDFKGHENQAPKTLEAIKNNACGWFYNVMPDDFKKISGSPISVSISDKIRLLFSENEALDQVIPLREGIHTADNNKFLRFWFEVSFWKVKLDSKSESEIDVDKKRWIPYNKGGTFRKWYGNNEFVIAFDFESRKAMAELKGHVRPSQSLYFKPGGTWSALTSGNFGLRYYPSGFLFDSKGQVAVGENYKYVVALMNTKVITTLAKLIMPTLDYKCGDVKKLPYLITADYKKVENNGMTMMEISKGDWDSYETSWDFTETPLIRQKHPTLKVAFEQWQTQNYLAIIEMKRLEEENNRLFIDAYDLQDELSPDVLEAQITLGRADREKDIQRLISYAIGCMMGRYSLDEPGLIYAHAGNTDFDPARYQTFTADDDGIIPLTDQDWFKDDATNRFRDFVRTVWGEDNLQANLSFVAESLCLGSLTAKRGEQSLETIRRYLSNQFYKDHLKTYKKRPIYWLFSSGKQKAFEGLVYLHRYNDSTLPRMRTEYVTPLLGKYDAFADQLKKQLEDATTSEATLLKKELLALEKKQTELRAFDDNLKHYADRRIKLDLDDGVKVNYGKFGDLLAEVKAVTGGKE
jgi:type II restriction/modification system DNA methylase subunit YeeA